MNGSVSMKSVVVRVESFGAGEVLAMAVERHHSQRRAGRGLVANARAQKVSQTPFALTVITSVLSTKEENGQINKQKKRKKV